MNKSKLPASSLRRRKGFTLVELIVVIAILAVLAAIAIPTFVGQLDKAKISTHNANYLSLKSAASVALAQNGIPATVVVWTGLVAASNTIPTGTTVWDASKYIDTWPTIPDGLTYDYAFKIGSGTATSGIYTVKIYGKDDATNKGKIEVTPAMVS